MKLWVMRHAFAGPAVRDPRAERERPLTAEGRGTARAVADAMAEADEIPRVIFCSPLERTTQTADIVGKALAVQVNVIGDLAPNRPLMPALRNLIGDKTDDTVADDSNAQKRVMLVCHVDNTTPLFQSLATGDDWDDLFMAEVRRINIDRDTLEWSLKWRLLPSEVGRRDRLE